LNLSGFHFIFQNFSLPKLSCFPYTPYPHGITFPVLIIVRCLCIKPLIDRSGDLGKLVSLVFWKSNLAFKSGILEASFAIRGSMCRFPYILFLGENPYLNIAPLEKAYLQTLVSNNIKRLISFP